MFDFLKNKFVNFALVAIIYILWVIWVGSWWLLIGLVVIFDIYITKIVPWAFWKKREGQRRASREHSTLLASGWVRVNFKSVILFVGRVARRRIPVFRLRYRS